MKPKQLFCKHDYQPDYAAYGFTKEKSRPPPDMLYLKKCSKYGKKDFK